MHTVDSALLAFRGNPVTAVVFDRAGQIVELISFDALPSAEDIDEMRLKYIGVAFRFVTRGEYKEMDVTRMIREAQEGFRQADLGLLHPGANLE